MAVALKSPAINPSQLEKHWSPSTFVDHSSCPSLVLNSPVSSLTSESAPFPPSTSDEQGGSPSSIMAHEIHTSSWYSSNIPASSSFADFNFDNAYNTPHTSTSMAPYSPPEFHHTAEAFHQYKKPNLIIDPPKTSAQESPYLYGFVPYPDSMLPARPRSSPSTFSPTSGPRMEDLFWQAPHGLGIHHTSPPEVQFITPTYGTMRAPRTPRMSEPAPHVPDITAPVPKRTYAPIAPNPQQKALSRKRTFEDDDPSDDSKRRKRSDSAAVAHELTEEDKLLLRLKDEENLPWKDIAARFQSDLNKIYQIPALQMRLKRLRERLRVWNEADLRALRLAHEYWIQQKYEIIAGKMQDFGALERWSARQCARKWQEIDPGPTPYSTTFDTPHATPQLSWTTSPQSDAHAFLPYTHHMAPQ